VRRNQKDRGETEKIPSHAERGRAPVESEEGEGDNEEGENDVEGVAIGKAEHDDQDCEE
jgi:hypothetical protein